VRRLAGHFFQGNLGVAVTVGSRKNDDCGPHNFTMAGQRA
jgi:hypothetical protein